jgi:phytoene desaturase
MGPSWYWMPEMIDGLFKDLGEDRSDYFQLKRLEPSYKIFWKDDSPTEMPATRAEIISLFESFEKNGGQKLEHFLRDAQIKYEIAAADFLENPGLKWSELINLKALKNALKLDILKSVDKDVSSRFTSAKARAILNFPVLFLGEMPQRIPSLYTLMNYADLELGTWYPEGGMGALAEALKTIAEKAGVVFHMNAPVSKFDVEKNHITGIHAGGKQIPVDYVIASADYNFVEQQLVPASHRRYSDAYWNKRKMAPSCLIYYIGLSKKLQELRHHNLFFDEDLTAHGREIYDDPKWPTHPLFYVCATSKTDQATAPEGHENLFVLIPVAPGIEDTAEIRDRYFETVLGRMEKHCGTSLREHVVYKRDYCISDFQSDYNAFKGNAYGLANTLGQTANLKPKITSRLTNLLFCGQLTVPGPGIPPALISGKIAAKHLIATYETALR